MDKLRTNEEWLEWGRRDPFFGVASWPEKSIGGAEPWTAEAFYALGESDWRDFSSRWRSYGYEPGTFVEIGCGAGRITRQLAASFKSGVAIDVSQEMIERAKIFVPASNVAWQKVDGIQIPVGDNSIDAVFSCHVFQHLPSLNIGLNYFEEIHRILKPSGSLMIHLPLYKFPHMSKKFTLACNLCYSKVVVPYQDLKWSLMRRNMKRGGVPPMPFIGYEQNMLYSALDALGFTRIEFITFPVMSNGDPHSFVLAVRN